MWEWGGGGGQSLGKSRERDGSEEEEGVGGWEVGGHLAGGSSPAPAWNRSLGEGVVGGKDD